jgi:hypothetical protein
MNSVQTWSNPVAQHPQPGKDSGAHGGRPQGPTQPGTAARVPKCKTTMNDRAVNEKVFNLALTANETNL